ncbi:four helix bundle protein [Nitrospiraceae bacterium HYJII51-Mn-bac16s-1-B09]|uniref:Four helix bundle protein n=2 Tax=Candidatus Manganitrophus noduliformans TaxID=2606439 RepID=A0A7X6DU36_9BACT|nr:four helix bundle protein [Candidatus Manganitrophus noduliformans]
MANQPEQTQERADGLEERLIEFAVSIIRLSNKLPNTPSGKHIAGQILRSGTSPAPNYGEARGAESRSDFIHKLSIVLKELNETSIWLRMIDKSNLISSENVLELMNENNELCRIITASIKTIRSGRPKIDKPTVR